MGCSMSLKDKSDTLRLEGGRVSTQMCRVIPLQGILYDDCVDCGEVGQQGVFLLRLLDLVGLLFFLLMHESLTIQGLMYCNWTECSRSFACGDRQRCLYLFECEHGCIIVNGSYDRWLAKCLAQKDRLFSGWMDASGEDTFMTILLLSIDHYCLSSLLNFL